jgi:hypothetical protein
MISLITKTGTTSFNLKNGFSREIDLCMTISRLKSKNSTRSINITTSDNEKLSLKISDIINFKFRESEFVKSKVRSRGNPKEELAEKLIKNMGKTKKKRIENFLDTLKDMGAIDKLNPDDPFLHDIIDKL